MSQKLTNQTKDTLAAIDQVRQELAGCASLESRLLNPIEKDLITRSRAATYIWLAALLERHMYKAVSTVIEEINAAGLAAKELRISLHSILSFAAFSSLRNLRDTEKSWKAKIGILSNISEPGFLSLSSTSSPLDGRTIEPYHFELLWLVFGFPGQPLPSGQHKGALLDLSTWRNKLAHGEETPVAFSKAKTHTDVVRMTDRIEELVEHFLVHASTYLATPGFRR